MTRNNLNSLPQQQPIQAVAQPLPQQTQIQETGQANVEALLKEPLESFLLQKPEYQRNILGTILYPIVQKKVKEEYAPKVTGMLIDFENFGVTDILEFIVSEASLNEVIAQAENIINSNLEGENAE